jgi:hypothetical protein
MPLINKNVFKCLLLFHVLDVLIQFGLTLVALRQEVEADTADVFATPYL